MERSDSTLTLHKGFLDKRSPSLLRRWQKRWFLLSPAALCYYEPNSRTTSAECKGLIAVASICRITYDPVRDPRVFSVHVGTVQRSDGREEGREAYQLRAELAEEAAKWVEVLNDVIRATQSTTATTEPTTTPTTSEFISKEAINPSSSEVNGERESDHTRHEHEWIITEDGEEDKESYEIREGQTLKDVMNACEAHRQHGRLFQAETLARRALRTAETSEQAPGDVTLLLCTLATVLRSQGRYDEAISFFKRSLNYAEETLGPEHRIVGKCLTGLASLHHDLGNHADAELLFRRALCIDEVSLGRDSEQLCPRLHHLAGIYLRQGRFAAAEGLLKRALEITERIHGPEDMETAMRLWSLAYVFRKQGRDHDATPLYRRVLGIFETTLGPENARTQEVKGYLEELEGDDETP